MPTNPRLAQLRAAILTTALGLALLPGIAVAQTVTDSKLPAADKKDSDDTVILSPFVVNAAEDAGNYRATSTLAGTRVRTNLDDVASAISVVTQQFLQDTGATNNESLLIYATNSQVGGLNGNFAGGQAGQPAFSENTVSPQVNTRVRGLSAADNTRDFFTTDIPADFFDVGRVDLQRGPNSILFGVGEPGGIINVSLNDAIFKNAFKLENRVDGYGSIRQSADLNYDIIRDTLAIRFGWLADDEKYRQKPAFNDQRRIYGALHYEGELLGKGNHTSFRAKYEGGDINSNNPRQLPPADQITSWFALGKPTWSVWQNPQGTTGVQFQSPAENALLHMNPGTYTVPQGNTYWPDVKSYFNSGSGASETPIKVVTGNINGNSNSPGFAPNLTGIGDLPDARPFAVPPYATLYANNNTVGGAYYTDKVINDPSIFNFYNNLLDGPNKREWQSWNATNLALSQTFFDDSLAFEVVYDKQHHTQGQNGFMQGDFYAISVEANSTYTDGTPNPNVGRPYVASYGTDFNNSSTIDRNSLRFTTTYEFRSDKFFGKDSWLTKVLGRSVFTGLLDRDQKKQKNVSWSRYATTPDWAESNNVALGNLTQDRQFDWLAYLGPSLLGATSAQGANINRIQSPITPAGSTSVTAFNSHYTNSAVNPNDPFSYYSYSNGSLTTGTQADNPANYGGWQSRSVSWLDANNPQDFPQLVTGGIKTSYVDNNQGFIWQGYMFEDTLVPTIGVRKDRITSYTTAAPSNPSTSIAALNYNEDLSPANRVSATGTSHSWGGVYHLPHSLTDKLPWGTTIGLYYNRDQNFKAETPQFSLLGTPQPNPDGKTKEYGVTVSTFNNKMQIKLGHYSTTLSNDPIPANLGTPGYFIWASQAWGYVWAAQVQDYLEGKTPLSGGLNNYAAADGVAGAAAGPGSAAFDNAPQTALQKQIVQAWLNLPLNQTYFDYYKIHPVTISPAKAVASGQLSDALGNGWVAGVTDNVGGGYSPGNQQPGAYAPVSTETTISSGTELELSFMPKKNWNVTLNYSTINATRTGIDPATTALMASLTKFYSGAGGQIREWYNGGPTLESVWTVSVANPYQTIVAQQGQRAPDLPKWQGSVVSTYAFDQGLLKGVIFGGALRMESSRVAGYQYDATLNNGLGGLDVSKPWMGPSDSHLDLWLGYKRPLFHNKVNWRIQLNTTNVGEKTRLVPASYEPDGSMALGRIQNGMEWQLTNTIEF